MSVNSLQIKVEKSPAVYAPGEIITGKVFVSLKKKKSCRGIKLKLEGKARVHWNDSWIDDRSKDHTEQQHYLKAEVYVFGASYGDIELVAGEHIFPFVFALPANIPNSFYHEYAQVEYELKAVMERTWGTDYKAYLPFKISSPFDPSQTTSMHIVDKVYQDYNCLTPCISAGYMEAYIRIPRHTFEIDDQLEVFIDVEIRSESVKVRRIDVELKQTLQFHAESRTKSRSAIVQSAAKRGPFPKKTSVKLEFQVPKVHPSGLQHCSIISIKYCLGVKLKVSDCCNSGTERKYDIEIRPKSMASGRSFASGWRAFDPPPVPVDSSPRKLPISQAPSEIIEDAALFAPRSHPLPSYSLSPIGFAIEKPPPPSYESVMAQENRK